MFCIFTKYNYIARVKAKHKEVILMYSCYVEVVFHFVAKAILFLCFFGFDIILYPYILFHFLKCFLLFYIYMHLLCFAFSLTIRF